MDAPVDVAGMICSFLYPGEKLCPEALLLLTIEPRAHRFPIAIAFGEVAPRTSGTFDPQDAVQNRAVIEGGPSGALALRWEQWSQLAPLLVRQFIASYHTSFLPVDDTLRTEPREPT